MTYNDTHGVRVRLVVVLSLIPALLPAADNASDRFESSVRPLLAKNCWSCHRQSAMGGLRLDSREAMLKGGKSGPALTPGNSAQSLLVKAVLHQDQGLKMPPSGKMSETEIATLREWIDAGAEWPESVQIAAAAAKITPEQRAFWAFQKVRRPQPGTTIDGLIRQRLMKEGLRQVRTADKRTLIRRATLDLTGLPPTPEEVDAFNADKRPDAWARLVDRLLASPAYGERQARLWLDVARYADDRFNSTEDDPYPHSWRYRNWVIQSFNQDLPYDKFVKAQIAGDALGDEYAAGLGFYALSPEMQDDRVDATTRGFLGVTVACAQCHDHKFDPIPTEDFYSLQGVFANTKLHERALAPEETVENWKAQKKRVDDQQALIDRFYARQREELAEILAASTARYMLAAKKLEPAEGLDAETLQRWERYLSRASHDHGYLTAWQQAKAPLDFRNAAVAFQRLVTTINEEKKRVDERNKITLGNDPDRGRIASATLESLDRERYVVWKDMFERSARDAAGFFKSDDGVFFYGKGKIERWLQSHWRTYLERQQQELEALRKALPEKYPFLHTVADKEKVEDIRVQIRGDRNNPGDVAPRRFLAILSEGERKHWKDGSGRVQLADAIANADNPLTARVMANRVWYWHFGRGIVATPNNFGQLGERPSHPDLLDYLAWRLVDSGWSLKALHREILMSETYRLSSDLDSTNEAKDPGNTFLWRYNRRRLDIESMRDATLQVSGELDRTPGEKAERLDDKNVKRTVYGFVSRRKLDGTLALFDFPNANSTSEGRTSTNVPLQRLFFMNSSFVETRATALAKRFAGAPRERITGMYRTLFSRTPDAAELKLGLEYVQSNDPKTWTSYARVLLTSNEFTFLE